MRPPWGPEDGTTKGMAALIFALAAVLLFAPVARADVDDATHPYRNALDPTADGTPIGTTDDDEDDDEDEEDERSEDDDEDEDDEDERSEDEDEDEDDGSSNPPTNQNPPSGPAASATPLASGFWLGVLLVLLAGIAGGTAVVLRRRMIRNR
jgi:hypothetical protein